MERSFLAFSTRKGPRRGSRRFLRRAFYLLVLFALVFAVLETLTRIGLRRWGSPAARQVVAESRALARGLPQRFVPAPGLNYRLAPDFVDVNNGANTRHNRQGFRAAADFVVKTSGTLRIACLGASTTYGVAVNDNHDTYPDALERLLNRPPRPGGWSRVTVYNLGVGGYTSAEVLVNLQLHTLPLQPDVVLIQSAINDVIPRFYDDFDCGYASFRKPMQPLESGFCGRLLGRSSLFVWLTWKIGLRQRLSLQSRTQHPMPPVGRALANLDRNDTHCYRANLEGMIDLAAARGIQPWLLTTPYNTNDRFLPEDEAIRRLEEGYRRGIAQHNEIIRRICAERAAGLIDLDRLMPRDIDKFSDPIHMTVAGNRLKAELIAAQLRDRLPASPYREADAMPSVQPLPEDSPAATQTNDDATSDTPGGEN
jgi:lysophospholipase L1-like esterase